MSGKKDTGFVKHGSVEDLKSLLRREIKNKIKRIADVGGYGDMSELDKLLSPRFADTKEQNGLLSFAKCGVPDYLYGEALDSFGRTMTDHMPKVLNGAFRNDKVAARFSFPENDKFFVTRFYMYMQNDPSVNLLVEYKKHRVDEKATLAVTFSEKLAEHKVAPAVYTLLWNRMVANESRLVDLFGDVDDEPYTEDMKSLGLELYRRGDDSVKVGGYSKVKEAIKRDVFFRFTHPELIRQVSAMSMQSSDDPINAILFYGPSGTGKTLMARSIANDQDIDMIKFSLSSIYTKWYGESQKRVKDALQYVEDYSIDRKTVLFVDEVDFLGNREGANSTDREDARVLDNILMWMDGMDSYRNNDNLLVIFSTNFIDGMDKALSSRFKNKIYFPLPNHNDRYEIFRVYAKHLPKKDLEKLAESSDGLSGRDISSASQRAVLQWSMHLSEVGKRASPVPFNYYMQALKDSKSWEERSGEFNYGSKSPEGLYS